MLSISLARQNGQHWACALNCGLCPMFRLVHRTQTTLSITRAEIKQLPPKISIFVRLARRHHVQSSLGNAIWHLDLYQFTF
jgi:hypothetical protein